MAQDNRNGDVMGDAASTCPPSEGPYCSCGDPWCTEREDVCGAVSPRGAVCRLTPGHQGEHKGARDAQTMADIAELLAHGYDDASDDHNWMMAQSIYDLAVEPLRAAISQHRDDPLAWDGDFGGAVDDAAHRDLANEKLWAHIDTERRER